MELTFNRTAKIVAALLLFAAISQPIYTLLYLQAPEFDRQFLWGLEGLLFVIMAAIAGSAMAQSKRYTLIFSAIAFSAVLNVIQVGVGLTQFGPAREAAEQIGAFAGGVYTFSFFCYNGAKVLLGLAALDFGLSKLKSGGKVLGGLTVLFGVLAIALNAYALMFGREVQELAAAAGASGVVATLLLAICLLGIKGDE